MDKYELLKKYFGHKEFRKGQEKVIDAILEGRDALCVMPTGAGKSICYQIPALASEGITLVISPLISLMDDQVGTLTQMGIEAAYINSSLSDVKYNEVLKKAEGGCYKIIYIAPERLLTSEFIDFARQAEIFMVAVDESHCVSQWGQDFRPSYTKIPQFIDRLSKRPVVAAFTATATLAVREDISALLQLKDPLVLTTGFDRKNLYFGVRTPKDKKTELIRIIKENEGKNGIVYCSTRKVVEEICHFLCFKGYEATRYHAGLEDSERKENQDAFIYDRKQIMVATNAFGMGIDKSNVSFVVHYNMPKNLECYYQEAGRAGRDGGEAQCILLYSGADVRTNMFMIDKSDPDPELSEETQQVLKEKERERLKIMTFYCTTGDCLRAFILKYFGERYRAFCGKCSSCSSNFEIADITVEAQKILSCILRVRQSYGVKIIVDVLRGSKSERILRLGFDKLSTYGIMKDYSEKQVRAMMDHLLAEEYITLTNTEYPVVTLTPKSGGVLKGQTKIDMKLPMAIKKKDKPVNNEKSNEPNDILLTELKRLRSEIASKEKLPAYIIFSDATLRDMCDKRPGNAVEFLEVSGVGDVKLGKYGEEFIKCIASFNMEDST